MRLREILRKGLALVGVVMVFVPVLNMAETRLQVAWVVVGVLLIEVGVWNLASGLLPDDREYDRLRHEVDGFLDDVRDLNERAVASDHEGVRQVRRRLEARLDDIVAAAGQKRAAPVDAGERDEDDVPEAAGRTDADVDATAEPADGGRADGGRRTETRR